MAVPSAELEALYHRICQCQAPEELFGSLSGTPDQMRREISQRYRGMAQRCHPDRYTLATTREKYLAEEAFRILNTLRTQAEARVRASIYGQPYRKGQDQPRTSPVSTIRTKTREYRIMAILATGTISRVYLGEYDDSNGDIRQVAIKIAEDPADNDLIRNEQAILQRLKHQSMPALIETFTTRDNQAASVLRYIDGVDLHTIRENPRYTAGLVPRQHIAWILERQLSVLGFLHSSMVIHGHIEPGNIMVRPRDHNVFLIDFVFSPGDGIHYGEYLKIATENYSAPEVYQKRQPLPTVDLYSLGKCMVYLLGGDPQSGKLPADLDHRIARFITHLIDPDYLKRARDAWQLAYRLLALRREVFGPPKFIDLPLS